MGRVAEEDFGSEAADLDVSAADGIKEGDWYWKGSQERERYK